MYICINSSFSILMQFSYANISQSINSNQLKQYAFVIRLEQIFQILKQEEEKIEQTNLSLSLCLALNLGHRVGDPHHPLENHTHCV